MMKQTVAFRVALLFVLLAAMWLSPAASHAESVTVSDLLSLEMCSNRDEKGETTQLLQELDPVLFVVRHPYRNVHGPDETMYQSNEIVAGGFTGRSALKVLDAATGKVRTLLELPQGNVRDPFVHYDGKRILLSIRKNAKDDYHLYTINSDGTGLKQLTSAPNVTDIQPVWLPNGRIMFSSTRCFQNCGRTTNCS